MHKLKYLTISIILLLLLSVASPSVGVSARPLLDTTPDLGTANNFAVLAGSAITNTPTSAITGDVGLSPAAGGNYAGLTSGEVTGTIYAVDALGPAGSVNNPGLLTTAKSDLVTAYDRLIATDNATCDRNIAGVDDLSLLSPLGPGVYCATAFIITNDLVLAGAATDIWIFRSASTIDTDPDVTVSGPASCSVWWRAETSVTIGTDNTFIGNILALASISDDGGSTFNGRLLARNQAVTLNNTTINRGPLCVPFSNIVPAPEEEDTRSVSGLPNTGGAPIREDFPWNLVIVAGLSAMALGLGVRSYRRTHLPKQ